VDNKVDGVPGAGEDETRADWSTNVNSDPPDPASPPAAPPATPPAPVTPSGPPPGLVPGPPGAPPPWQPVGAGAWTPPPADGGKYAVPGVPGLEFAGGAPRVVAYVIDAIIITILNVIVGIVLGIVLLAVAPNIGARPIVGLLIGAAIDAAYFMLLWTSAARATLGMRVLNLQVGNAFDGRRL